MLYLKIYNEDGVQTALAEAKSFTVHYACIWGKDTTWTATVAKGQVAHLTIQMLSGVLTTQPSTIQAQTNHSTPFILQFRVQVLLQL